MFLRDCPRYLALGVVGASVTWLASTNADACSCAVGASLDWPAAGQTGVPLDTSIVVSGFGTFAQPESLLVVPPNDAGVGDPLPTSDAGGGPAAPLPPIDTSERPTGLYLVAPDQAVVTLIEERVLLTVACTAAYRFYRQETGELEPNTAYRLYEGSTFVAAFTTGAARRDVEAEIADARAVNFEVLGTTENPPRVTTAYVARVPSALAFVHYTGSSEEVTYRMYERLGTDPVTTYDFGALSCPLVEIVGMDGQVLDSRKLCEPDRCTTHPDSVGVSTCGGNYTVGVTYDQFKTLPGCGGQDGVPPMISPPAPSSGQTSDPEGPSDDSAASSSAETIGREPGPAKVPIESGASAGSTGCDVGRHSGRGAAFGWLASFVLSLGLLRRRPRR